MLALDRNNVVEVIAEEVSELSDGLHRICFVRGKRLSLRKQTKQNKMTTKHLYNIVNQDDN